MADPVSFGASVLAFITIAAQLSKTAVTIYGPVHDAPNDIKCFLERLQDLEFILDTIHRYRTDHPTVKEDNQFRQFWNVKLAKLQRDFSECKQFTTTLSRNTKRLKSRCQWLLSHQDRAKKILATVSEDIEVLKSLHSLMVGS
jgi:hypothetical protein